MCTQLNFIDYYSSFSCIKTYQVCTVKLYSAVLVCLTNLAKVVRPLELLVICSLHKRKQNERFSTFANPNTPSDMHNVHTAHILKIQCMHQRHLTESCDFGCSFISETYD